MSPTPRRYQAYQVEAKEERFAVACGGKDALYFSADETDRIREQLLFPGIAREEWIDLLEEVQKNTVTQQES